MSSIQTYLRQILNAVYGKDVRQSIHDAIQTCYEDASAGITPTITTEAVSGGNNIIITVGDETQTLFVADGANGLNGIGSLPDGTYTGQILHAGGTLTQSATHVKFFIPLIDAINRTIEITNPVISVRDRGSYLAQNVSSGITYTYTSYATGVFVIAENTDCWGGANNSVVAVEFSYDLAISGAGEETVITIDSVLDSTSENPVQNKVVKEAVDAVGTEISNIKADLESEVSIVNGTASNIMSSMPTASLTWMSGTIATTGVANSTDVKRIRNSGGSTMPKAVKGDVIYVKHPYQARVIAYNGNQLSSTSFYAVVQGDFKSDLIPIDDAYIGKYIGIAIKDSTQEDSDISSAISTIDNYVKIYRPSEYLDSINADLENVNQWIMAVDTDTEDETDKTDMASAITTMLTNTGYCHLGEGIFYVSGIDMPVGSKLEGCGKATEIRLLQSSESTYCIKMAQYCTISNLQVTGSYNTPTISSQGTRSGIAFMANSDGNEDDTTYKSEHCMIDNVWVSKFTNSGILCHNTSKTYRQGLHAVNVMVQLCWCGVNIDYISEFNKFTNLLVAMCIRGCMNNGGNNVFTACTFYGTQIGYYVDGSQPNSAHGTINGCTFCHSGSSTGSAITMSNVTAGFVVSACQIHYNSIDLTNCSGVSFVGCEFGRGTTGAGATINIDGGNLVLFNGCTFIADDQYTPDITITNNTKVKFDSCYGSVTGNLISA